MNSSVLHKSRLPISVVVSALVVAALLLLPSNVAGFGLSVSVEGSGAASDEFALGNDVPFTVTLLLGASEVLNSTVTVDVDGPAGFARTFVGLPLGSAVGTNVTTTFGPSGSGADVPAPQASPVADTTIAGTVTHGSILTEFDQPFVGYGFGYKGLVDNASITIDGVLSLPSNAPAGKYTLEITVDNGAGANSPQTVVVELTLLPGLVVNLPVGWSTYSIPIAAENSKFFASAGLGTGAQDGLVDPAKVTIAFKFDAAATTPVFTQVVAGTILSPTEAVLVKSLVEHDATLIVQDAQTNPPSRLLSTGWNLFGLAVPLDQTTMDATDALVSVLESAGGLTGYSIVVSPTINPDPFILTKPLATQDLTRSRGYWVFMENDDTLAGFSTTPVGP